jgi:hypothetical protein
MTKLMEEKYATQFQKVKAEIKCASFLSFTTDVWTNKNKKKSFIRFFDNNDIHYI